MRRIAYCLVLFLSLLSGPALATELCDGSATRADLERYQSGGSKIMYFDPDQQSPYSRVQRVRLQHVAEDPQPYFRVYAFDRDGPAAAPVRAQVLSVNVARKADDQGYETLIDFRMPNALDMFRRLGNYDILVVACPSGQGPVQTADAGGFVAAAAIPVPLFHATGFYSYSTNLVGAIWLALAALFCAAVLWLATQINRKKHDIGPFKAFSMIFAARHYQLSLAKFQLVVFTIAVLLAVAWVYGMTGRITNLSADVLVLMGIAAGSTATASVADRLKDRLSWRNWIWLRDQGVLPTPQTAPMHWSDLVTSHGEFDPSRFQALVFTLLIAPAFVIASLYDMGNASIPDGILAVLGLSQVTYIAGKIVAPPTVHDFDRQIDEYRALPEDQRGPTDKVTKDLHAGFEAVFGVSWTEALDRAARRGAGGLVAS